MSPTVDWLKFLWLMDGQCEPGLTEYDVDAERARQADIGEET